MYICTYVFGHAFVRPCWSDYFESLVALIWDALPLGALGSNLHGRGRRKLPKFDERSACNWGSVLGSRESCKISGNPVLGLMAGLKKCRGSKISNPE